MGKLQLCGLQEQARKMLRMVMQTADQRVRARLTSCAATAAAGMAGTQTSGAG
jgi:hypothetical protein